MTQTAEQRRLMRLASSYNTKAARFGVRGTITAEDLGYVELISTVCFYCGIELEIGQGTFDHMQALNRGGSNTLANIVRSCMTCNRKKFDKNPTEFARHQRLVVTCARPGCGNTFQPRWAEWQNGRARLCSRRCSALWRWEQGAA